MKPTRPALRPVPAGFVRVTSSAAPKRGLGPALQVTIGTAQRCPLCHDQLAEDQDAAPLVACAACLTVAHAECVDENARCSTLGCGRAPPAAPAALVAPVAPVAAPGRSWAVLAIAALAAIGPSIAAAAVLLRPVAKPDVIFVAPPAPPAPPPLPQTVTTSTPIVFSGGFTYEVEAPLVEVVVPGRTSQPNVTVRGRITRCSTSATLEVTGPEGDVRLPARPGPFELLVTLPRDGHHRIAVTLREPRGAATTVERDVLLQVDGRALPQTLHDDCETTR